MQRQLSTARLALYLSLLAHAALLLALLHHDLHHFWLHLPPLPRATFTLDLLPDPDTHLDTDPRNRFGEDHGKGYAVLTSLGHDILFARRGDQDQPSLSRDPVGPGPLTAEPSQNLTPAHHAASQLPSLADAADSADPPAIGSFMIPQLLQAPRVFKRRPPNPRPPEPIATGPAEPAATPDAAQNHASTDPPQLNAQHSAQAVAGSTETTAAAADPAPEAESDSDPFATIGSVAFKPGRVDARLGRKVKAVRPRLTIKAQLDLISIVRPRVLLKVAIADTGKVTDVAIIKSSGSNEIDLPVVLSLYKWWIEPSKDPQGNPTPDVISLAITLYD